MLYSALKFEQYLSRERFIHWLTKQNKFHVLLSHAEVKHWVRVAPLLGIPASAWLQQHHDDPTREREWYRRVWSETTLSTKTPTSVSVCDIGIWKRGLIWGARRYFLRQIWAPYIFHESQTGYPNRDLVLLLMSILPCNHICCQKCYSKMRQSAKCVWEAARERALPSCQTVGLCP